MDTPKVQNPLMIYTEQTPNPETLKFVCNRLLYNGSADFQDKTVADEWSPLAKHLYKQPYVKTVYISSNYVSIGKENNYEWFDLMHKLKEEIKTFIDTDEIIVKKGFDQFVNENHAKHVMESHSEEDAEIAAKVHDLINTYVKPAVEADGGNIVFKSFKDGVVTVIMQGSCSGCPSSTVTLKSGIESMLMRMVPEVKEVVQEME